MFPEENYNRGVSWSSETLIKRMEFFMVKQQHHTLKIVENVKIRFEQLVKGGFRVK